MLFSAYVADTYCCCSIEVVEDIAPEYAELTPLLCLGVGSCAGIIDTSATYPKDMVCGRLTVQMEASPGNRGIIHALSTVFGEEGSHALHKEWLPSVIVIPYASLNFTVHDFERLVDQIQTIWTC